mmetsp:Transcript_86586/g.244796  ORF Transcript_86586/g.244796 Transcript_86586/m.244796 type:complete len:366 (-) Transcript_86586:2264-3361(-)
MSGLEKMTMVNPLDPTSCAGALGHGDMPSHRAAAEQAKLDGENPQESLQRAVGEEVDKRMAKASEELVEKYARGEGGQATSNMEVGPTGAAYTAAARAENERKKDLKAREDAGKQAKRHAEAEREAEVRAQFANNTLQDVEGVADEQDEDSDAEWLDELEDSKDQDLMKLREQRIAQMKVEHELMLANKRKGHGELTEIVQDEFLPSVMGSKRTVCHFYHKDFERCKIMDMHLTNLAAVHVETKFVKINAEKCPFFTHKLDVQILPTVICFFEGITKPGQRQIGFMGLNGEKQFDSTGREVEQGDGDDFPTERLAAKLGEIGVIDYTAKATMDEMRRFGLLQQESSIKQTVRGEVREAGSHTSDY